MLINRQNVNKMYIGEKFKTVRKEKGISLTDLAEKTGIIVPYLARLENDIVYNPGIITFIRISNALDLNDSEILQIINSLDT